jgi:gliding motility-associated lipoprotein GldH
MCCNYKSNLLKKEIRHLSLVAILLLGVALLSACKEVALYSRITNIEGGSWQAGKPVHFELDIPKAGQAYYLVVTIRHTHLYAYRNLWIRLGLQPPGADTMNFAEFDLQLANNERWLGVGMNDTYERRLRLFQKPVTFASAGKAKFSVEHIMRSNPLDGVLQVGLSLEPVR